MKKPLLLASFLLLLPSCGNPGGEEQVIYTSFYPVYDLAKRIVRDHFVVKNLTPAGVEPHDYELTNKDMVGLSTSKAFFINGLGLEHYYDALPSSIKNRSSVVSKDIETLSINGTVDPHIWLDPLNAVKEMENIVIAMKAIDPEHSGDYQASFEEEKAKFIALDQAFKEERASFKNEYFAVSHASFGYFAKAYGLTQIYVSGLSPDQEPSAQDMERIAAQIKEHGISTIFTEELVSPEIAEAIARETSAKIDTLNPLEGLSEEEMKTDDYLSIMRKNFNKLKEAAS